VGRIGNRSLLDGRHKCLYPQEIVRYSRWSTAEFRFNVSSAYIYDIEHGRREISKQFAKQLVDFLKISIARLI
jgi:hypothetical protein